MRHLAASSLLLAAAASSSAATTFYLQYSGAPYGNGASASGFVVIDENLLLNPGTTEFPVPFGLVVLDVNLVVSGAASGNGTFTLADFVSWRWNTGGATLDLGAQLVGQPTNVDPWGTRTQDSGGDFNLFSEIESVPNGTSWFTLTLGGGEQVALTSFSPVPEPSTYGLILGALALAGAAVRRRKTSK